MRAKSLVAMALLSTVALSACGSRVAESDGVAPTGAAGNNTASDTGVTATTIKIGSIVGLTSGLGPDTFSASRYGAQAYFNAVNANGGVNDRKIEFVVCDDKGDPNTNEDCARKLVDDDKVFALAGVTALNYGGATYLNSKGVPDIAGQPIDNSYDRFEHLYSLYGSYYPRDNKLPGYNGTIYAGTEAFQWLKQNLGATTAGIVYYNVGPSQRYAKSLAAGLRDVGFTVVEQEINLSQQNYDAAVLQMKSRGVDTIFDAMETNGNLNLCRAMVTQGLNVKAKVTTTQGWTDDIKEKFASVPSCRNVTYAISQTRNYNDTDIPAVAKFRKDMDTLAEKPRVMHLWALEGYVSAMWLTDAMRSCGSDLTRKCVEAFMNRPEEYKANGLITSTGRNFVKKDTPPATDRNCINVGRWQDSANGGQGAWVTQVRDMTTNCFSGNNIGTPAA